MAREFAPPPLLTIVDGATSAILPQFDHRVSKESSSSASPNSIIVVIIIISSAIVVSTSLYLLIRFISRRLHHHRHFRTHSAATDDDVVVSDILFDGRRVSPADLIGSLPLFTFGSVTGKIAGGDCAVCLSNFETDDQLRLLPLCCHAFHAQCIDTWLLANQTCPLCRSTVCPVEPHALYKIRGNSFRIELGSVSRRRQASESGEHPARSYSIGSFDYIVDDGYEVSVESTRRREISDSTLTDKDSAAVQVPLNQPMDLPEPPGQNLAGQVSGRRNWLKEYVDRFASISHSTRTLSFRNSGRFFAGSSRRSDNFFAVDDLEAYRIGEEISEVFRWLSGE